MSFLCEPLSRGVHISDPAMQELWVILLSLPLIDCLRGEMEAGKWDIRIMASCLVLLASFYHCRGKTSADYDGDGMAVRGTMPLRLPLRQPSSVWYSSAPLIRWVISQGLCKTWVRPERRISSGRWEPGGLSVWAWEALHSWGGDQMHSRRLQITGPQLVRRNATLQG